MVGKMGWLIKNHFKKRNNDLIKLSVRLKSCFATLSQELNVLHECLPTLIAK